MTKPFYKGNPIASLSSLSAALDIPEAILLKMSKTSGKFYRQNPPKIKPNGKKRITYSVDNSLKAIHEQIKVRIFHNVYYPRYLQGAIKDENTPRDYISDAAIHSGRRVFISEDVSDFFPSITEENVLKLWLCFFNFPPDIANLLTKLTIYKGFVPQGSKTSSYIANLIFWKYEPELVNKLEQKNITYTRFVDDITLSFDHYITNKNLGEIISLIFGMMAKTEIRPNREKQNIVSRRLNAKIHNLNVSGKTPTINKKYRNNVRLAVYNCIKHAKKYGTTSEAYKKMYKKIATRVGQVGRLHKNQSDKYKGLLRKFKPKKQMHNINLVQNEGIKAC